MELYLYSPYMPISSGKGESFTFSYYDKIKVEEKHLVRTG
jgi:hypothetical protein